MKWSSELIQMLHTKSGYRNEDFSGSGERVARDVIKFEIYELGNEDIIEFFRENYGLSIPYENYQIALEEGVISEADVDQMIDGMIDILEQKLGHTPLYALWLTSLDGVRENYVDEENMEEGITITKYHLPEKVVPVSDLGDEGALFIMNIHPMKLESEYVFLSNKHHAMC